MSNKAESFNLRLDRSHERFKELSDYALEQGLLEPCTFPDHAHASGAHTTVSQKGAELFDLLAVFVGPNHLAELAWAATMESLAEELVVTPERQN